MPLRRLGLSSLDVFPLCLGGNVFGWTATDAESFAVLDAYAAAGGNFIDTADAYSAWVPGHSGGESEAIIGRWMTARRNRARMVVATKVGRLASFPGLAPKTIRAAADASLQRLGGAPIDLYFAHADDPSTPLEDTFAAFTELVDQGKVRCIGLSNYTAARTEEALHVCDRGGFVRPVAVQPHYNLVHRQDYEGALRDLCVRERIACVPYYGLASGFLTGKYARGGAIDSPRAAGASRYLDARGRRVLDALDAVAKSHRTTMAAVALAWLLADPSVASPIASARTPEQLADLLPCADLALTAAEVARLADASA